MVPLGERVRTAPAVRGGARRAVRVPARPRRRAAADWGFDRYHRAPLVTAGASFGTLEEAYTGRRVNVVAGSTVERMVRADERFQQRVELPARAPSPLRRGQRLGTLSARARDGRGPRPAWSARARWRRRARSIAPAGWSSHAWQSLLGAGGLLAVFGVVRPVRRAPPHRSSSGACHSRTATSGLAQARRPRTNHRVPHRHPQRGARQDPPGREPADRPPASLPARPDPAGRQGHQRRARAQGPRPAGHRDRARRRAHGPRSSRT